jgi:DNA-directed RNA polymerase subunit alpha
MKTRDGRPAREPTVDRPTAGAPSPENPLMSQALEVDLKQIIVSSGPFGPQEIERITTAMAEDPSQFRSLREAVEELEAQPQQTPASAVRLGVCYYLIGRAARAAEFLANSDGGALARFYLAKCASELENHSAAAENFDKAAKAGYDANLCALGKSQAQRRDGDPQAALKTLDNLSGPIEQTADYLAERAATVAAIGGNPQEVVALYERAVDVDDKHPAALFGLAMENDRRGNDHTALSLYERSVARFPAQIGSLINLGLMYEDLHHYDRARMCFQRVINSHPSHPRARLFLKDVEASRDMYYDEEAQRRRDRLGQILGIPVTDFELSVRSRNCLQKMGIETLGDLTQTTEQELLASKNFGETSLVEIREMLHSKGLSLGQFSHERREEEPDFTYETLSPDERALLERPIADLNLSVRARKCMVRLGISTVGELLRRTGDELLESKNFGVTSLNEVREKLSLQGLKLRGE